MQHARHMTLPVRITCLLLCTALSRAGLAMDFPETPANMAYSGIYDVPVRLVNGVYEGEPYVPGGASRPRVELLTGLYASSGSNMFVLLGESSGGTGSNLYLAAISTDGGNIGTDLIGDRVDVISLHSEGSRVVLDYVTAGPGEAACCPSLRITRMYGIRDGELVELSRQEHGSISLASLSGTQWRLLALDRDTPLPEDISITAGFDDTRVSGSAGCNRYFAPASATTPYDLSVGPAGATRMACPQPVMQAESRFLNALQKATQFSFRLGRLAIGYRDGDTPASLLFERIPPGQEEHR